jgi:hypothetical protein
MTVVEVLKTAGFESALIIDDAFDEIPIASDLAMDADAWSIFIADIGDDIEHIEAAFPKYHDMDANALRTSNDFVKAMYGLKDKLRSELWNTLFESYERDHASDREFLRKLQERLTNAGLQVVTAGRSIPEAGRNCKIVFADLFLGASQQDFDVDESVKRLLNLVAGRESAPPAVVLMSRSPLLKDKKERFRDDAKMVGAMFRVYRKHELLEGSTVETVLERLATHYADAVRVAAFLAAWESGLADAAADFMKLIRRLDLSDYNKIREVLLDAEGQPLGSYMLDVFDRVLQHQIEGRALTISTAVELSHIDPNKYPTPYIAGSPDLQDMVTRVLWQHPDRLKVAGNTAGMPVSFGDVLVCKTRLDSSSAARALQSQPDVLVVLTPACDLVRNPERRRVLLVGGAMKPIDSTTWRYKQKGISTPILQLAGQPRMFIEWDLYDQRMLDRSELASLIAPSGPYFIGLRFRESNALELQQRFLSNMGRVGLLSTMPFTFQVEVLLFTADVEGKPQRIDLPTTAAEGGVCITGRDDKGDDLTRLVLTEPSVDEILSAVQKIKEAQISPRARDALRRLQASSAFRSLLQRGLEAPLPTAKKGSLIPLKVPAAKTGDEQEAAEEIVGLIARNPELPSSLSTNEQKNSAIIIVINDVESGSIAGAPLPSDKPW